jgi:class 3 adenylate cyclase
MVEQFRGAGRNGLLARHTREDETPDMSRRGGSTLVTILFTDIVGSSDIAVAVGDRRWKVLLEAHNGIVRRALRRHGGKELDTAGDGFFAVFDRQAESIRCAVEIVEGVREIGLEVRAGLHVGEAELIGGKVGGVAVHTGARVGAVGGPGEVVVSSVLRDLVPGAGIDFRDLGDRRLKGVPEEVRLWAVLSVNGVDVARPLDPSEAAERWERVPVPSSTRTARIVGAVAGLSVVVGLIGFLVIAQEERTREAPAIPPIQPNTLIRIDPASMEIDARYELSAVPKDVVFAADLVWILEDGILEVLDPSSSKIRRKGFGFEPCMIAVMSSGVIVGDCEHYQLYRIDTDLRIRKWIHVPSFGDEFSVIETVSGLWVKAVYYQEGPNAGVEDHMFLIDPTSGTVLRERPLDDSTADAWQVAEAGGYLWTFNNDTGAVLRISPSTFDVTQIESVSEPQSIASNGEWVWLADKGPYETLQIDPANGDIVDRPATAGFLTATDDSVWAFDNQEVVTRVNEDGEITGRVDLPFADGGAFFNPGVYGGGAVWIAVQPAG